MRILHSSDWHLGQKLLTCDREEEHQRALDWLLDTIQQQEVEVLLVAGDVFDIGNPANSARRMYYRFLTRLMKTACRQVVITGGNHDSPSMLQAPRELLRHFNIHVLGEAGAQVEEEVIPLYDESGRLMAVVGAVPFLRDRDLKYSIVGERSEERIRRLRAALARHYRELAEAMQPFAGQGVPLLAMGHLYAGGTYASARQDNIYIGDTENIRAEDFPDLFDYVALGHLHRQQKVGGQPHIRYSGSLIPLSFSETKDEKGVLLLDWQEDGWHAIQFLVAPTFRRLKTVSGSPEEVKGKLLAFAGRGQRELTPWVEVLVDTDRLLPQFDQELRELVADYDLQLLKIRLRKAYAGEEEAAETVQLKDLSVQEVFRHRCTAAGISGPELEELETTFGELCAWVRDQEGRD
jgi:exonuclease SbcD